MDEVFINELSTEIIRLSKKHFSHYSCSFGPKGFPIFTTGPDEQTILIKIEVQNDFDEER